MKFKVNDYVKVVDCCELTGYQGVVVGTYANDFIIIFDAVLSDGSIAKVI